MSRTIRLYYHRPPGRTDVFEQELLYRDDAVLVTLAAATPLPAPVVIDGRVALENGAPAIWFTFPGLMHDVGRFHTRDGTFTGLYANVVMPVELTSESEWSATDLFLDVWIGPNRKARVLDRDELDHALAQQWITAQQAAAAVEEAARIVAAWLAGTWPPPIVNEWTIERVSSLRNQPGRFES